MHYSFVTQPVVKPKNRVTNKQAEPTSETASVTRILVYKWESRKCKNTSKEFFSVVLPLITNAAAGHYLALASATVVLITAFIANYERCGFNGHH